MSTDLPTHVRTFVIGAGFAGPCAAIKLDEAGERDYLVIERGSDVGGTWRDNTYILAPPATCPRSSTRSRSPATRSGRAPSSRSRRSRPTSGASQTAPACWTASGSTPPSRTRYRQGDLRPRAPREGHARLPDRLRAHPDLQRLVSRSNPRRRRPGHRQGRDDHPAGRDRARLPQPVLRRRSQHRAGTLKHGVHDRVAGRLRRGRPDRMRKGGIVAV
ncbi:MAG: NAD(P)-binding protein [Nocardioidaceae bacterium]